MLKDNRKLILLLIGLLGIFFIVRWLKSEGNQKTFDAKTFEFDTALVQTIKLYPATDNSEIRFDRSGQEWTVSKDQISSQVERTQVDALISSILKIKPTRLAGRSEEKWSKFHVGDSLGTRVVIQEEGDKVVADLVIGKFSYKQSPQAQMQGGIQGISYYRDYNDDAVFATDGFLSMTFNRDFNSFRDRKIAQFDVASVRRIQLTSTGQSSMLESVEGQWLLNGMPIDSTKMSNYMNAMANLNGNAFVDGFTPSGNPEHLCLISGDNMADIQISAYDQSHGFSIVSSMNQGATFSSDSAGVFQKVFMPDLMQ